MPVLSLMRIYSIANRVPNVVMRLEHNVPAYLDEIYPVVVCVTNDELEPLHAILDANAKRDGIEEEGIISPPHLLLYAVV